MGAVGSHSRFQSREHKTEAIIPGAQERREDRREQSFLGRGNGMCKGPEARKESWCGLKERKGRREEAGHTG